VARQITAIAAAGGHCRSSILVSASVGDHYPITHDQVSSGLPASIYHVKTRPVVAVITYNQILSQLHAGVNTISSKLFLTLIRTLHSTQLTLRGAYRTKSVAVGAV
jgi:hypothetical protein